MFTYSRRGNERVSKVFRNKLETAQVSHLDVGCFFLAVQKYAPLSLCAGQWSGHLELNSFDVVVFFIMMVA